MTPKQVDGIAYLLMFALFGGATLFFINYFEDPTPRVIQIDESCKLIDYKDNYFLNCK